jgi:hypothetical protein
LRSTACGCGARGREERLLGACVVFWWGETNIE